MSTFNPDPRLQTISDAMMCKALQDLDKINDKYQQQLFLRTQMPNELKQKKTLFPGGLLFDEDLVILEATCEPNVYQYRCRNNMSQKQHFIGRMDWRVPVAKLGCSQEDREIPPFNIVTKIR